MHAPNAAERRHDQEIEALWRAELGDADTAGFEFAVSGPSCLAREWRIGSDGTRTEGELPATLIVALQGLRRREGSAGAGMWISMGGALEDGRVRFERNWDERADWRSPLGRLLEPAGGEPVPSDASYRADFRDNVNGRDEAHWPAWLPRADSAPAQIEMPIDPEAPLPPALAELAARTPWGAWIEALDAELIRFCRAGGPGFAAGLRAEPDSDAGEGARGLVREEVPVEVWDRLADRPGAELADAYEAAEGRACPVAFEGTIGGARDAASGDAAAVLETLERRLGDATELLLESRIRR